MIGRIIHYHGLRRNRLPHRLAWAMSGLKFHAHKVINLVAFLLCCAGVLFLMSSQANSSQAIADNRVAAKVSQQAEYISALEKIVAACLSDSTGKPILIDRRIFLCGIYDIGESE